jgi:phosphatidate cytidylyltransferase
MLKLRVITALVLLPIVLGAVFYLERTPFAVIAGVFFLAGGWEWSAMLAHRLVLPVRLGWLLILAALMALMELKRPDWVLTWLPALWFGALLLVVAYPRSAVVWDRPAAMMLLGWWLLVPAWAAVVHLQDQGALGLSGPLALMFVLIWVWAADIGAYFAGRAFGRHKLAPNVSPGKTLEGLLGGIALALSLTAVLAWWWPVVPGERAMLLLVAALTVLASALGDLFESMAKRRYGIKDSGRILPGHGGMLDRIDSVTAALPVAVAAMTWTGLPGGV